MASGPETLLHTCKSVKIAGKSSIQMFQRMHYFWFVHSLCRLVRGMAIHCWCSVRYSHCLKRDVKQHLYSDKESVYLKTHIQRSNLDLFLFYLGGMCITARCLGCPDNISWVGREPVWAKPYMPTQYMYLFLIQCFTWAQSQCPCHRLWSAFSVRS